MSSLAKRLLTSASPPIEMANITSQSRITMRQKNGTLAAILGDVAAHLGISRDALLEDLFR
jgi:hypothetical protein